jgi:hypothetical protein
MSNAISIIKQDFLWSWQGRINREMELLQEVSSMPILRKYPD